MDQNMNFKEKWVYEEKVSSFKNGLVGKGMNPIILPPAMDK